MNARDEAALAVWQQVRHLPPEQRLEALDDQMRMDSLLKSFFSEVRADEYEVQLRLVSEEMSCVITGLPLESPSSGAL